MCGGVRGPKPLGYDMEVNAWIVAAIADAERRGLPELRPLIEALAQAMRALRGSDLAHQEPVPDDSRPQ